MIKIGKNNWVHPYDDLTDRDFGEYHVIKRLDIEDIHKGSTIWLCLFRGEQVEKSRKFLIRQPRLANAYKESCTKLIGKRFGMLTVMSYEFKDKRNHKHWKCKCDCGNVKTFEEYVITSGKVTSCGCVGKASRISANIKDDLKGKRFGRLTALYYAGDDKWHCKCDCGNEKDIVRGSLIRGLTKSCGCLHTEMLKDRIINIVNKKYNKLTALYYFISGNKTYWHCRCDCGNEVDVEQSHLVSGHTKSCGCLDTAHNGSKDELIIKEYLESIMNFSIDKTKDKLDGKEIDMYIDELNLGIEYNGSVFHASLNGAFDDKPKYYHRDKFLCAKEQGIHLINIFDVDWDNNQDKIKMYLKSLVVPNKKLYARKCELKVVTKQVADSFTDRYHIQGKARQNIINYGLYYNNELYAVMSFGKLRLSKTGDGQYELHRYCVKDGYTIVGGANKLLKAFEREHNPTYIRSYSDNDYFVGGIYERLGFNNSGQCTPRYYWYYHNNEIKRERCMLKHLKVDYPELLQEAYDTNAKNKEDYVMTKLGASKVYRSGNTKWEKTY